MEKKQQQYQLPKPNKNQTSTHVKQRGHAKTLHCIMSQ